jgi:hypothetical protein
MAPINWQEEIEERKVEKTKGSITPSCSPMDRTRIERFPRSEAWGAGAEVILENWDKIPYRLRAAIVETLEGQHTRQGQLRRHLQIDEGFRMHQTQSGRNKGYIYFKEHDGIRWRTIRADRAGQKLTSSRTASIWGKKSGYSHIGRRRVD